MFYLFLFESFVELFMVWLFIVVYICFLGWSLGCFKQSFCVFVKSVFDGLLKDIQDDSWYVFSQIFCRYGSGSKRKPLGTTGFGRFFLLPIGFFRYPEFWTHSQISFVFPPNSIQMHAIKSSELTGSGAVLLDWTLKAPLVCKNSTFAIQAIREFSLASQIGSKPRIKFSDSWPAAVTSSVAFGRCV